MLCERCNKKKIAVLFRENVNGNIRSMQLCHDCADVLGGARELEHIGLEVAGFVSPFSQNDEIDIPLSVYFPPVQTSRSSSEDPEKCRGCGMTREEIAKAGKVGCATCYTVYADELTEAIHSVHGTTEHKGRCSAGHRARAQKMERVATLRKRLKEAISTEQYENAAQLRDQIRALEAEL